ncbi:MAG: hypothetical protein ACRDL5_14750 [Solirubrobacteraceae bacterium]
MLVAGCGGSSTPTTTTRVTNVAITTSPARKAATTSSANTTSSSTADSGAKTSSQHPISASLHTSALEFSKWMRANGVPNFPDPLPGGGFSFNPSGIDRSAPAVISAQQKCHALMPPGPAASGSTTHPSAQTLAKLRRIAQCMRQHGALAFPDPRTSIPRDPFGTGTGVITDYDGAILLFPSTLNQQSPAYQHATAACGSLAAKLGTGPHGR